MAKKKIKCLPIHKKGSKDEAARQLTTGVVDFRIVQTLKTVVKLVIFNEINTITDKQHGFVKR